MNRPTRHLIDSIRIVLGALILSASLLGSSDLLALQNEMKESPVDRTSELTLALTQFEMADGPMWDGGNLVIPDVRGKKIYRHSVRRNQTNEIKNVSGRFSASFFNHGRHFLADNGEGRIAFLDGNKVRTVASFKQWDPNPIDGAAIKPNQRYRPNDLVVDQVGGIYVTFTPQNCVIYIAADGKQSMVIKDLKTPNGITLSPDGTTLYVSSFVPKEVFSYSVVSPGHLDSGKRFATMDDGPDRGADGMTMDRAGNIYCAGKSDIWIWSPDGKLLDKIACPTKPINCTFMGQDMRTLAIAGAEGIYFQRMKIAGIVAQAGIIDLMPPSQKKTTTTNSNRPSVAIKDYGIRNANLDVVYAQYGTRKMLADIFVPNETPHPAPCVIVIHGGGWHNGDKKGFRAMSLELCKRGYVTMAIEYRLADEAPFPAAMHDCSAAVRFIRAHASQYGVDPDKIIAVGGSAGGHLAGLMASGAQNTELHGDGGNAGVSSKIAAAVVLAGPLQIASGKVAEGSLNPNGKSNARNWMRGTVNEQKQLYLLADAMEQIDANTCPILFQVGSKDFPERNEPSRMKLKASGVPTELRIYEGAKHACWNQNPWFQPMIDDMVTFFKKHHGGPSK